MSGLCFFLTGFFQGLSTPGKVNQREQHDFLRASDKAIKLLERLTWKWASSPKHWVQWATEPLPRPGSEDRFLKGGFLSGVPNKGFLHLGMAEGREQDGFWHPRREWLMVAEFFPKET